MDGTMLDSEWDILAALLPEGWREAARREGAFSRARGIDSPDTLLRLILLHAAAGLSLRQTVARAEIAGLASITDVALMKRLRHSESWLRGISLGLLEQLSDRLTLPSGVSDLRVRAVDATTVAEPGATGTTWRLHYSIMLPSLECDFFEVTDASGGETLRRLPVAAGDVVLADRGYSQRRGVAQVTDHGAAVVVRLALGNFPLIEESGRRLNVLSRVRRLKERLPGEWPAGFEYNGRRYWGRLCAVRKSLAAEERARASVQKEARHKQRQLLPDTLESAGYVFVFTTLPEKIPCETVLQLYRARWQIELAFKRLKSLFGAGHVPKYDPESARAWIQAKLLAVLMIERLQHEAARFSPWGFPLVVPERVEGIH
jgi:hypothetical protein